MADHTKLQRCLRCAGDLRVRDMKQYEHHIDLITQSFNTQQSTSYNYTQWMYACEAFEIENNLPSKVEAILDSVPGLTK
ncbi:MAG: hypothetical protein JXR12_01485 [Neptunomonas phycophila]|uniref:hypothetical protein n=1 Tax=Neptunomonas phycophila TaxID=1572645 RepID=UPI003B8E7805